MKQLKRLSLALLVPVIFFCAGFPGTYLFSDADPFYTKLFQEGKTLYAEGKYREAIENFRIGEFGLFEEKEVLKELYLFYSLAYFKLGRVNKAREIIKKIETELGIKDPRTLPIPQAIAIDVKVMTATLLRSGEKTPKDVSGKNDYWRKIYNFETQFWNTWKNLENNKLDAIKNNIKKLESIDKKDTRVDYLRGILEFKREKYKGCIKSLSKVEPSALIIGTDRLLLDGLYYYLALSHHHLKNEERCRAYSEGIGDKALKTKLKKIIEETKIPVKNTKKKTKKNIDKKNM